MKNPSSPSHFNRSRLIRLLAEFAVAEGRSKKNFAERLGQWLDLNQSIALSGALHPSAQGKAAAATGTGKEAALAQVQAAVARVQEAVVEAVRGEGQGSSGKGRLKLPTPTAAEQTPGEVKYLPYRRYYLALQREMEASIGPLRASVRDTLRPCSPALRQLAAVDGVLETALAEREQVLLLGIPLLLESRFEQLRQAHLEALGDAPQGDDPAHWMAPGGWLATFCKELQEVLLAELEIRLQPVLGLVEALSNEVSKQQ